MFQDSLLIIKFDYLTKRKPVLLYLLQQGFFIKGQRKICFTPELAAEFYQDQAEDPGFMFQVILLSKGNSEAFILCKECCVEDLLNHMVCYFGTSNEMEQNVHVTKCLSKVQKEISFIFPNYIYEPIYCPEQIKFCTNNTLVESTITTIYDILKNRKKDPHKSWKEKLAESLISQNKSLPHISNKCCYNLNLNAQDMAQQTKITCFQHDTEDGNISKRSSDLSKDCSSLNITTSSCVSCSGFDSGAECIQQTYEQLLTAIIKARTVPLTLMKSSSNSTVKPAKESSSKELKIEEPEAEIDLVLYVDDDDVKREGETNQIPDNKSNIINDSAVDESKLIENSMNSELQRSAAEIGSDIILNPDVVVANEIDDTTNEIYNVESPQLSIKENKSSLEELSEGNTDPVGEPKTEYNEGIITQQEDKEIADTEAKE